MLSLNRCRILGCLNRRCKGWGHSLLEAIVATAIFVLVSVAMSGVWVMYGSAMTKSGDQLAANQLARSQSEALISNGYEWLLDNQSGTDDVALERSVRGRDSTVTYHVKYKLFANEGLVISSDYPEQGGWIVVEVSWRSDKASKDGDDGMNNRITYKSFVSRHGVAP